MNSLNWVYGCIDQAVLELQHNHKCLIKDVKKEYVARKESVEVEIFFDYDERELRYNDSYDLEDLISPDTVKWRFLRMLHDHIHGINDNEPVRTAIDIDGTNGLLSP